MVKDNTREKLFKLEEKYGLQKTLKVAKASLSVASKDGDFKKQFNGEICESVLELIILDLMKSKKDLFYSKGVVIPDVEKQGEFLTEIDFVVYTAECVYCIECKSYAGEKRCIDSGTIVTGKMSRDVYKQNYMHLEVLDKLIRRYAITPVYQMLLFNFSTGNLIDERSDVAKREFPVVNENNVVRAITRKGKAAWDLEGLRQADKLIRKFSAHNQKRHLEYVKSLHRQEE